MRELKSDWRDIFLGFRIALDPKKMLLGMVFGFLCLIMVMFTVSVSKDPGLNDAVNSVVRNPAKEIRLAAKGAAKQALRGFAEPMDHGRAWLGVATWWSGRAMWSGGQWVKVALVGVVWAILGAFFWSVFGAPLLRLAGLAFTRDEAVSLREAMDFAGEKRASFFFGPLISFIIVGIILLAVFLVGLLPARIPILGPLGVGVFFPLAILAGLFSTLILIGGVFGGVLIGPTVAVEGTDWFDGISRGFGYVYQKPWRYIWYSLVAAVYGVICVAFVAVVAYLALWIPLRAGGLGMGTTFAGIEDFLTKYEMPAAVSLKITAVLVKFWMILVYGLVFGFAVSYCATAHTIIYCLLRKDVDGTDMTEVYVEEEEEDFEDEEVDAAVDAEEEAIEEDVEAELSAEIEEPEEPEEPEEGARKKKRKTKRVVKKAKKKTKAKAKAKTKAKRKTKRA